MLTAMAARRGSGEGTDGRARDTILGEAGGATIVEFKVEVPGTYLLVDHSLARILKGAVGQLVVTGPEAPDIFRKVSGDAVGTGGH